MRLVGAVAAAMFVGTVWLANWLVVKYGPVPVGFGLEAPAGVYAAGLAFTLRDVVHRTLGRWFVGGAILVGCLLAYLVSDGAVPGGYTSIAVASAAAFLVSEFLDLVVFEFAWRRTLVGAVLASNVAGIVLDSVIFLTLAFGSLTFLNGQIVGKFWMTLAALPVVLLLRQCVGERRPLSNGGEKG